MQQSLQYTERNLSVQQRQLTELGRVSLQNPSFALTETTMYLEGRYVEKTWDNSLSTLINDHPQAFLDLLLAGAVCLHHHRTKLGGTQRQPDAVLEVERYDEIFLFNPEFQSSQDTEMAERLLLYHMLLWSQFHRQGRSLAVRSCVVSLWEKAQVAPSPLLWTQPGEPPGQQTERIRFSYETIGMWEIPHQVLLDLGHVVLYPLLPLTKGGGNPQDRDMHARSALS